MESRQVLMRISCDQTLVNICLGYVANMIKNGTIGFDMLAHLPKNLLASLLNTFSKRGYLTDSNIELFVSENTRELDLSECDQLTDKGLLKILKCKNLKKIDLDSRSIPRISITATGIDLLAQNCRYLNSILLARCSMINDECIETIARCCPKVRLLSVAYCPLISDKTLVALGNYCNELESIRLNGTKVCSDSNFF
ncbi:AMN1 -like protein, partial [Brachionus plicatilis]